MALLWAIRSSGRPCLQQKQETSLQQPLRVPRCRNARLTSGLLACGASSRSLVTRSITWPNHGRRLVMRCLCVMGGAVKCVARWCKAEMLRLTISLAGKMVVAMIRWTYRFFVPHVTPKNSGLNTTQENKKFSSKLAEMLLENKFQIECTKKFSSKTSSDLSQNRS